MTFQFQFQIVKEKNEKAMSNREGSG